MVLGFGESTVVGPVRHPGHRHVNAQFVGECEIAAGCAVGKTREGGRTDEEKPAGRDVVC